MSGNDFIGIRLIVGLGNPGSEYAGSRHNAGFALVDKMLGKLPKGFIPVRGCKSCYWRGTYAGKGLLLQKPMTYMNLSGEAVSLLANAEQLKAEEIMVVYDDMDLPLGRIRIRGNGGCGGHNGISSIIEHLKTESFPRLRIGIGKMANGRGSAGFVLSGFEENEKALFDQVCDKAADALVLCLRRGLAPAMTAYNAMDLSEKPEEETSKKTDEKDSQ